MSKKIKWAFNGEMVVLPLDRILPVKSIKFSTSHSNKYNSILASIKEVGLVEPLVVFPEKGRKGFYCLLDGHLRYKAISDLGWTEAKCLVAKDEEYFSYNYYINRLAIIQEHRMIVEALSKGLSEEELARTLNVDVKRIRERRDIVNGICPEAVDMLKDKQVAVKTLKLLKKVKPIRQIEIAETLVRLNYFSAKYVEAQVLATAPELMVDSGKPIKGKETTLADMAKLRKELETLERKYRLLDDSLAENTLKVAIYRKYLKRILDNSKVKKYLFKNYPELLSEFREIIEKETISV